MPRKKKEPLPLPVALRYNDDEESTKEAPSPVDTPESVTNTPAVPDTELLQKLGELHGDIVAAGIHFTEVKSACAEAKAKLEAATAKLISYVGGVKMPLFDDKLPLCDTPPGPEQFGLEAVFPQWYRTKEDGKWLDATPLTEVFRDDRHLGHLHLNKQGMFTLGDLYDRMVNAGITLKDMVVCDEALAEAIKRSLTTFFESHRQVESKHQPRQPSAAPAA